jgi:hypothetical protein
MFLFSADDALFGEFLATIGCMRQTMKYFAIVLSFVVSGSQLVTADGIKPSPPHTVDETTEIRALPGKLNSIPVFNSNSPEVVQNEGILLSTFPPKGMKFPAAHLNHPLNGDFSIFFHHISNGVVTKSNKAVFIGIIAHNPNVRNAVLKINRAAKYLSQPDAPFKLLPSSSDNAQGDVYAGPGDRVMSDFLHSKPSDPVWPITIVIPPHQTRVIAALPIPIKGLVPPINGLSGLIEVHTSRPVYLASLALYGKPTGDGIDNVPELSEWDTALHNYDLVRPREKAPTAPGTKTGITYGRVAGVSTGTIWDGLITDGPHTKNLSVKLGQKISYPISSIEQGAFGTGQIQSANMAVRYPDTAHQAHGNFGVHYALQIPLHNTAEMEAVVTIHLQTPLKSDERKNELKFYDSAPARVFFRGTVRVRYLDDNGQNCDKYIHLVQNRGEKSGPLMQFLLKAGEHRRVQLDLFYPPDATPPQVLTIKTFPLVH